MASWTRWLGWTALLVLVVPVLASSGCTAVNGPADWRSARRDSATDAPDSIDFNMISSTW